MSKAVQIVVSGIRWFFEKAGQTSEDSRAGIWANFEAGFVQLMREFFQNSLDQLMKTNGHPGKVTIVIREHRMPKRTEDVDFLFGEQFMQHLDGILEEEKAGRPKADLKIAKDAKKALQSGSGTALILEDFSTTGLTGCIMTNHNARGEHFQGFMRGSGSSASKEAGSGGTWGLGKITFLLASKVKTFFAYSVRSNTAPSGVSEVLMGRCSLPKSVVANQEQLSTGLWGMEHTNNNTYKNCGKSLCGMGAALPVTDIRNQVDYLGRFKNLFGITRNSSQPGLSLVIPYHNRDVDGESFGADDIARLVVQEWLLVILRGLLEVQINYGGAKITVNKNYVDAYISQNDDMGDRVKSLVKNSINSCDIVEIEYQRPKRSAGSRGKQPIAKEFMEEKRDTFVNNLPQNPGDSKMFKISNIPSKNGEEEPGFIYVQISKPRVTLQEYVPRPQMYRGNLRIGGKDGASMESIRGTKCQYAIDMWAPQTDSGGQPNPVHEMLRAGETPSHTDIKAKGEKFEAEEWSADYVRFVVQLYAHIAVGINVANENRDSAFFSHIFPGAGETPSNSVNLEIIGNTINVPVGKETVRKISAVGGNSIKYEWTILSQDPNKSNKAENVTIVDKKPRLDRPELGELTIPALDKSSNINLVVQVKDAAGTTAKKTMKITATETPEVAAEVAVTLTQADNGEATLEISKISSERPGRLEAKFGYESLKNGGEIAPDFAPNDPKIEKSMVSSTNCKVDVVGTGSNLIIITPNTGTADCQVMLRLGSDSRILATEVNWVNLRETSQSAEVSK